MVSDLDFVFVAVDDNETRQWLLPTLGENGVPFIDVGMGIEKTNDKLLGIVRTSFRITEERTLRRREWIAGSHEYERNVQIVELNALNAALAVIRWKKYRGFYLDLEENRSTYTIDGNHMNNKAVDRAGDHEATTRVRGIYTGATGRRCSVSIRFGTRGSPLRVWMRTGGGDAAWSGRGRLTYDGRTVRELEFSL